MGLKKIISDVDRIKEIVEKWGNNSELSDIERELVLDKLKRIYEEVMFFEREAFEDSVPEEKAEAHEPEKAVPAETAAVPEPKSEPVSGHVSGAEPQETDKHHKNEPAPAHQPERVVSESIVFEEEEREEIVVPRQPIGKDTIMSLYGDDPAMTHVKRPQAQAPSQPQAQPQPQEPKKEVSLTAAEQAPEQAPEHENNAQPEKESEKEPETPKPAPSVADAAAHKKVLGEVISNGAGVAINETLGKQQPAHTDIASKIHSQATGSIRQSIGINDRFLLIRDLFGGDASRYDEVINTLDDFTDLDDALIYIAETYTWNPDGDGAKLLVDLLEKKLG